MTISVYKPQINLREKLTELETHRGVYGSQLMAANSPDEAWNAINIGRRNLLINGDFQIWQRGTTHNSILGSQWTADRWNSARMNGAANIERGSFDTAHEHVPGSPEYYYKHTQTSAATDYLPNMQTRLENIKRFSGREITISFYIWCDVDMDILSYNYLSYGSGLGGQTFSGYFGKTSANSWRKMSLTLQVPRYTGTINITNYLGIYIQFPKNLTFQVRIADVQVEYGGISTPFDRLEITESLHLCQRYYYSWRGEASGWFISASDAQVSIQFPVEMYENPTVTYEAGSLSYHAVSASGNGTISTVSGVNVVKTGGKARINFTSGRTAGEPAVFWGANGGPLINFDAEIGT